MFTRPNPEQIQSELLVIRIVHAVFLLTPPAYVLFCYYLGEQFRISGEEPVLLRSILYFAVIVSFPMINLIRHIMLRLNQTLPGDTSARSRYFVTVLVSLGLAESIGLTGVMLYIMGDNFTTLLIYNGLALLALLLYRPKCQEYSDLVQYLQT